MASKVTTLFEDSAKENALYPRTKVSAVSDNDGNGLDALLNAKQNQLVSGTNIKTVNGESLLGAGNISGIPELTIKGTATLTVDRGSITSQNIKYALTEDRKVGMIWGEAIVKGDTTANLVTCEFNISVAPQTEEKVIVGLIQNSNGYNADQIIPHLKIRTNGSVYTQYALTTNNVRLLLPPTMLRFSDF